MFRVILYWASITKINEIQFIYLENYLNLHD